MSVSQPSSERLRRSSRREHGGDHGATSSAGRSGRRVGPVEAQEDVLDVGRGDRDVPHVEPGDPPQQRVHVAHHHQVGVARAVGQHADVRQIEGARARPAPRARGSPSASARRAAPGPARCPTIRPSRMIATRSQLRSTSGRLCDERKTVLPGRRGPPRPEPEELPLHQRVQPGGGLVHHQQGLVPHEDLHDGHLLPVAAREPADLDGSGRARVARRPAARRPSAGREGSPGSRAARRP